MKTEVDIRTLLIPGTLVRMHMEAVDADVECVVLINHATTVIMETATGGARFKIDDWLVAMRKGFIRLNPN